MSTILEDVKASEFSKKNKAQLPEDLAQETKLSLHIVPEDDEQAYFWSKEWQKGEFEAESDKRIGRISGPFGSVEALKNYL